MQVEWSGDFEPTGPRYVSSFEEPRLIVSGESAVSQLVEGHVSIKLGYCLDNLVTVIVLVLIPVSQQVLEMKRSRGFEFNDKLGLAQRGGSLRDPHTV